MKQSALAAALLLAAATSAQETITVRSVVPGSPAAAAGVEAGDRLVRLGGREIASHADLAAVLDAHRPGDIVPLVVEREGETVELALTLGERPDGGVSIGVQLAIDVDPDAEPGAATVECLAWIAEIYRIESLLEDLGLDLSADHEAVLACVERDTRRMSPESTVRYCDNVLKVHCAGLDLLTEIGEALARRCEDHLAAELGLEPRRDERWKTCGQHWVFDRYVKEGEPSDAAACEAALRDACGTGGDAVDQPP